MFGERKDSHEEQDDSLRDALSDAMDTSSVAASSSFPLELQLERLKRYPLVDPLRH